MKSNTKIKLIFILLISSLFVFAVIYFYSLTKDTKITSGKIISPIVGFVEKVKESKLPEIFEDNFSDVEDDYAVVIKNLKSGETFTHNKNKQFDSASLYKLWVLVIAKEQLDNGILDEDNVLSAEKIKLDERLLVITPTPTPEGFIPTLIPEEDEKEIVSIVAKIAIEKMITISDNYSALLVSNIVGIKNITNFLEEHNFKNSNYNAPPQTTANDIANYFELLYDGKFINEKASNEMIEILKQQEINDRIPKYLPKDTDVAHKTGELLGSKHDAGIVYSPAGEYIIVVLSKTKSEKIAAEKIANFSKDVFEYFNI